MPLELEPAAPALVAPVSALDLLRGLEAGKIAPEAVVETCAEAIATREHVVRAFVRHDIATARRAAGLASGPLRGLPLAVKDIIDTADFPTEHGSPIYSGNRPRADAAVVAMAKRAGAVVLGKTVTTEFAYFHPGATRNPWNPGFSPGGSSSGSAAAVASGMAPFALGTQTGGSVIRPAAFCGVAGFKPSFRLIPTAGVKCFSWSLDTVGLFAARVADVAAVAALLTERDLRVDGRLHHAPRIALARTHLWDEASGEMRAAVEKAARMALAAGAMVSELELPDVFQEAFAAHQTIQDYEACRALAWEMDRHGDELSPILRETLERGRAIPAERYDAARRKAREARLAARSLFDEVDVLLTPSAPGHAPEGLASTGSSIFNRLWTLLGLPAVNVPGLAAANGLPLGVQVVGRFGRDSATLAAAHWLEQVILRRA